MEGLRTATLLAAVLTAGIGAGVYQLYSFVIMPGLGRTNDRTFVGAFQQIDRAIVGPFLLIFFVGALTLNILSLALNLGEDHRTVLPWIAVALGLHIAIAILTIAVNVPLNNDIKAAGNPDEIDVIAVRERFQESRWSRSNFVRVIASTTAFGCLAWALVLHGRG